MIKKVNLKEEDLLKFKKIRNNTSSIMIWFMTINLIMFMMYPSTLIHIALMGIMMLILEFVMVEEDFNDQI